MASLTNSSMERWDERHNGVYIEVTAMDWENFPAQISNSSKVISWTISLLIPGALSIN